MRADPLPHTTLEDNLMYVKIFAELTEVVGYAQREWITEPTPGGWRCNHLLTGMTTPAARTKPLPPPPSPPHTHVISYFRTSVPFVCGGLASHLCSSVHKP